MKETINRKRRIKFVLDNSETIGKRVRNVLCEKNGLLEVRLDVQDKVIFVEYDLLEVTFEQIEKWLKDSGITLSKSLFARWKRGWTKFTEQNELDSLSAKPTSCCEDPKSNVAHSRRR